MSRSAAFGILAAAVLAVIIVGALVYFRIQPEQQQAGGVPPLPANAVQFGVWSLIGCQQGGGDGACRLVRRVINDEAERVVLSFVVTRGPTGNALIAIGLPPSVVIPRGVTITPQAGSAVRGAVQRCSPQLCTAVAVLNDALIEEMSVAQIMGLQFVAANGRNVNINVPIAGFGEGINAWLVASPAPAEEPAPDAGPTADEETAGAAAPE
jgi:invasion protein IalB